MRAVGIRSRARRSGNRTMRAAIIVGSLLAVAPLVPAHAQFELAGSWRSYNAVETRVDIMATDYTGTALNEEGRAKALSYSSAQLSHIERQCQGWSVPYMVQGPFGMKIWALTDPSRAGQIQAFVIGAWEDRGETVIWMDGRPHPSEYAMHTRSGFTTGRWTSPNTLETRTTHIKAGYFKRNGLPSSDQAVVTTWYVRHGNLMDVLIVMEDPVFLAEPYVGSSTYEISQAPIAAAGPACIATFEGLNPDEVPAYLPEENPSADEQTRLFGVPMEAAMGHPETLYPEYHLKMKAVL